MSLDVKIIQHTFELLKTKSEEFANRFYQNLFQDYPASKELFSETNMERQKRLFLASLVQIVSNLERPEFLTEYLGKMGERHFDYKTADEHFELVGLTLLKTQQELFPEEWTREFTHQWALAFDFITAIMQDGLNRRRRAESDAKVLPIRPSEPERASSFKDVNLRVSLPVDLTQHLDELAKHLLSQAIQDYFQTAIEREIQNLNPTTLKDLIRRAS